MNDKSRFALILIVLTAFAGSIWGANVAPTKPYKPKPKTVTRRAPGDQKRDRILLRSKVIFVGTSATNVLQILKPPRGFRFQTATVTQNVGNVWTATIVKNGAEVHLLGTIANQSDAGTFKVFAGGNLVRAGGGGGAADPQPNDPPQDIWAVDLRYKARSDALVLTEKKRGVAGGKSSSIHRSLWNVKLRNFNNRKTKIELSIVNPKKEVGGPSAEAVFEKDGRRTTNKKKTVYINSEAGIDFWVFSSDRIETVDSAETFIQARAAGTTAPWERMPLRFAGLQIKSDRLPSWFTDRKQMHFIVTLHRRGVPVDQHTVFIKATGKTADGKNAPVDVKVPNPKSNASGQVKAEFVYANKVPVEVKVEVVAKSLFLRDPNDSTKWVNPYGKLTIRKNDVEDEFKIGLAAFGNTVKDSYFYNIKKRSINTMGQIVRKDGKLQKYAITPFTLTGPEGDIGNLVKGRNNLTVDLQSGSAKKVTQIDKNTAPPRFRWEAGDYSLAATATHKKNGGQLQADDTFSLVEDKLSVGFDTYGNEPMDSFKLRRRRLTQLKPYNLRLRCPAAPHSYRTYKISEAKLIDSKNNELVVRPNVNLSVGNEVQLEWDFDRNRPAKGDATLKVTAKIVDTVNFRKTTITASDKIKIVSRDHDEIVFVRPTSTDDRVVFDGDPGHARNGFFAVIEASAKLRYGRMQDVREWRWAIAGPMGGANLTWSATQYGQALPQPTGNRIFARYGAMPQQFTSFGEHTLTVTATFTDGRPAIQGQFPLKYFFAKSGTQVWGAGRAPNWYHYWTQLVNAAGIAAVPNVTYQWDNATPQSADGTSFTLGLCQNRMNARRHTAVITIYNHFASSQWNFIQFAKTYNHENVHFTFHRRPQAQGGWGANWNYVAANDEGGANTDFIPDAFERANPLYFQVGRNDLAGGNNSNSTNYQHDHVTPQAEAQAEAAVRTVHRASGARHFERDWCERGPNWF